ncbi:MAG: hypothetical protein ABI451_06735 [Dokdonella sp.]
MNIRNNLSRITKKPASRAALQALVAVAAITATSTSAFAAVVCNNPVSIPVPQTVAGIYLNLVTGIFNSSPASAPGWDFNPWGTGSIFFYENNAASPMDGGVVTSGTTYAALASGSPIGAGSTYTRTGTATTNWGAGVDAYLGIRFLNEGTAAINYGWIHIMTTGPTTGLPATILGYCYDNTGADIMAGTTPVSLKNFSVD